MKPITKINRRQFLQRAATASLAIAGSRLLPSRVWAGEAPAILPVKNPNSKLQIAVVGLGGISMGHIVAAIKKERLVALCDCYQAKIDSMIAKLGTMRLANFNAADLRTDVDYREMLAAMGDKLDAVAVCTPDHNHAIIGLDSMKAGKHVLLEKPMAHNIAECYALREAGRKYRVATQQGNERHSGEGTRRVVEMIQAGAIGPVREVYYWSSRSIGGSDEGIQIVPQEKVDEPFRLWSVPVIETEAYLQYKMSPHLPAEAKWNFGWRGDRRWGTGALGDWGAHLVDEAYWALKIDQAPQYKVETVFRRWGGDQHYYRTAVYRWTIPERADMPSLTAYWYNGMLPNDDPNIKDDQGKPLAEVQNLPPPLKKLIAQYGDRFDEHGTMFVGEKGVMVQGRILPDDLAKSAVKPPPTIPRAKGDNDTEWYHAIRTGEPSSCNFDYSAGLVEHFFTGLLTDGVAMGEAIEYDAVHHRVTSHPELNQRLSRRYRKGYEI